mgnify:CR=1 FL=1
MKKVAVVYWSGTGNTEAMANAVVEGVKEAGGEPSLIFSDDFKSGDLDTYDAVAFGCPAMGDEVLEEDSFEPMYSDCEPKLKDRNMAIFGSYEWNNAEWMEDWKERVEKAGGKLVYEVLPAYDYPNEEDLEKCRELGKALVNA